MSENYKIIKEITKNNKKISIIQNSYGKKFFRKLIINKSIDAILSLKNEIKCLNILNNTGIVPNIIDYNLSIDTPYIITEYIDFQRLDEYNFSSLNEKLKCFINILNAIHLIHLNKIIHCDLKPQQIFVDNNLNVKIIDFGISSINGEEILSNYGSINYCSPEKISKQKLTTYSDMFSLGIIFYKLITSNLPFERNKDNIMETIDYSKIRKIENEELNMIFYKAINENQNFRYKNSNEFKDDLIKFLDKKEEFMNNKEKYLPIGTVVLLNGAQKRIMIIGFMASANDSKDKVYDYMGCLYPMGVLSSDQTLVFNHDQIDKIYYMGYTDKEEKEFKNNLQKLLDETQKESEN